MSKIFYTETGYNRTTVKFYELVKETKYFYTLVQIDKFDYNNGVTPNPTKIIGGNFRVKKTNYLYRVWEGQELKENNNYTYAGA